jgi:NAD(P)-dependent dehydrogenase (short-subunit alcohol dehydrogenase family)
MDELAGKVAVVTGAASGIGRATATAFAAQGMRVVLSDIEEAPLATTVEDLRGQGHDVVGVRTDVSSEESVAALAAATIDAFGAVHVVHNNAGVVAGGPIAEIPIPVWEWVLGVDLWSVIYGVRTFLPLIEQAGEGHIINTASTAGLQSGAAIAPYNVAKFGVVALTETLATELAGRNSPVGCSVLCPGAVDTAIVSSHRNEPASSAVAHVVSPVEAAFRERAGAMLAKGMAPERVAEMVVDAVLTKRFWIVTHEPWLDVLTARVEAMRSGKLVTGMGG